jgi:hypothetical protein
LVLAAAGCGLSDYEKHMDEQQAYVKIFDEENQLLGDPLEAPVLMVKQKNIVTKEQALPAEFFARPPKGIASKVADKDGPFIFQYVRLYRYAGPAGYNVLVTTGQVAAEKKDAKPVVKGVPTKKEFQHQVRRALVEFYRAQFGRSMPWLAAEYAKTKQEVRSIPVPGGAPVQMTFEVLALADRPGTKLGSQFFVYFTSTPLYQGAIIYQVPAEKSQDPDLAKALNYSLNTFALSPNANKKRQDYRRRRKIA